MHSFGVKLAVLVAIGGGVLYVNARRLSFQTQPEVAHATSLRKKPWLQRVRTFCSYVMEKGSWQEKLVLALWAGAGLSALMTLAVFLKGVITQKENWQDHLVITALSSGGAGLLWFLYACLSGGSGGSVGAGGGSCGGGVGGSLGSLSCSGIGSSGSASLPAGVMLLILFLVIVGGLLFGIGYAIWYLAKGSRRR